MKQALLWMVLCMALPGFVSAQSEGATPAASSTERMFFPRDTFWGYGQFDLAPPHNEIDPNLCRADAGISGGAESPCNAFARYMISGYVESASFWPGAVSQVVRVWGTAVPVWQESATDALHVVDGRHRAGEFLGWGNLPGKRF